MKSNSMINSNGNFALLSFTAALIFAACTSQPPEFDETEWYAQIRMPDSSLLYALHQNPDGTFFNPWMQRENRRNGGRSWFWSRLLGKKKNYDFPAEQYAAVPNNYAYLSDTNFNSISFAGHASFIIKLDGETVFTDPFFSNAALVVGKKVKIKFDFSSTPRKPVVLISHNHYDHLDKYSVKKLIKKDAVFIAPLGLKEFFVRLGAKEVYELDWWQSIQIEALEYTLLPAQHWSRRIGQANNTTLWGGYLVRGSKTVYFSGDSGYFAGFAEFGRRYVIDYALVGAGAYDPRWFMHYSHMNVEEFFLASEDLNAKVAVPMHFGVISLSDEPVLYPLYEVEETIKRRPEYAQRVHPLRVGEFLAMEGTSKN